ncbi:hypothetical protein KCU90_g5636, partial [Aureobasidium melanogenum]
RKRFERWQRGPERHVRGRDNRANDKRGQRDDHACTAATHGVQRAGRAATAQLHADAEHEGPDQHRRAGWRDQADYRPAEQRACGEHREEQQYAERQHQHLCAQTGAAAVGDKDPPCGGKAERRMVKRHTQQRADDIERRLATADGLRQIDSAQRD